MASANQNLFAKYDIVVIGGGPVGLSTALECAKAGRKVLVLEQSVFFNQSGSSGDLVRMFRTAYTEDFMATLAVQSMSLWDELEAEAGEPLRMMSGLMNFGDPNYGAGGPEGTLLGPIPNLNKYNMAYTRLNRDDIQEQYPFQNLPEGWEGLDMPDNGCINVPLLLRTLHRLCTARGVDLFEYATVGQIAADTSNGYPSANWVVRGEIRDPRGVSAQARKFSFRTDKIAITAGAYVNHVLYPSFGFTLDLSIWEMVYAYYTLDPRIQFPKMWFQFEEDASDGTSNLFYGFPALPWGPPNLCRIAVDAATNIIADPSQRSPSVIPSPDLANTRAWVSEHVLGVGPDVLPALAGTCLQTNVSDNMFVLDFVPVRYLPAHRPGAENSIAVFTAGWAMKFVPLLGRVLSQLVVDGQAPEYDISHFSMDRKPDGKPIIRDGPVATQKEALHGHRTKGSSLHHLGH
ncbi:FAD/NAD(P)-binding domain-containing protein [Trametopsis cervina]|nr:FAD/NAD(P)-binding domain-containing protein [Trametopsis cervina]